MCERRLHRRIPEHRLLGSVDPLLAVQVEERRLRGAPAVVVDRRVLQSPVDRQPELAPEAFVCDRDACCFLQAQRPELRARRVRLVDLVLLLDVALGREPVVVETHRIEDLAAPHALVADDELRLRVRHRVAHVQVRGGHVGRRRVDREDLAGGVRVELVDPGRLPQCAGALLDEREIGCLVETHARAFPWGRWNEGSGLGRRVRARDGRAGFAEYRPPRVIRRHGSPRAAHVKADSRSMYHGVPARLLSAERSDRSGGIVPPSGGRRRGVWRIPHHTPRTIGSN